MLAMALQVMVLCVTHHLVRESGHLVVVLPPCSGKGWCLRESCLSRCALAPISFSDFFDGWKQTERRGRRVKGARSLRSSERTRRPLTQLPRSVHSPAKKWGRCISQDAYAEDPTSTTVPG